MRIRYWTIAINPHPTLLLRFGAGIIVEDVAQHTFTYRIASLSQLPQGLIAGDTRQITKNALDMLENHLSALAPSEPSLDLSREIDLSSYLHTATDHLNGLIDLRQGGMMAWQGELKGAADHLFGMFVHTERDSQQRPITRIRQEVQHIYTGFQSIHRHLITQPNVETHRRQMSLDLAVVAKEKTVEINRAFSFRVAPNTAKLNQFDAWTLRIRSLRDKGGLIRSKDFEASLPTDVPVVAFVDQPETDKQAELQKQATMEWGELGINIIPLEDIPQHAQEISNKIPA